MMSANTSMKFLPLVLKCVESSTGAVVHADLEGFRLGPEWLEIALDAQVSQDELDRQFILARVLMSQPHGAAASCIRCHGILEEAGLSCGW